MESFTYHFEQINWVAVVVTTVFFYLIGGFWYSKAGFGDEWMKAVGLTKAKAKKIRTAITLPLSGFLAFTLATALAILMCALELGTWQQGVGLGTLVALGIVIPARGIHILFEGKSLKLFVIDAGYSLLFFATAGAIIGIF